MALDDDMQSFRTKAVTNGDRIRNMTDAELADTFHDKLCDMQNYCPAGDCMECLMKWLKKEAADNDA